MVFSYKLGALPENVLTTLLNDRLVAKGTVCEFITTFFQVRGGTSLASHVVLVVPSYVPLHAVSQINTSSPTSAGLP
jgi:hypothetical protein